MARYYKQEVLGAVTAQGMIPVFYNADIQTSKNVLKACYDGGVRMLLLGKTTKSYNDIII